MITGNRVISDLLSLVGIEAAECDVASWTERERRAATEFAEREHLAASDNPIKRYAMPGFLRKYHRG